MLALLLPRRVLVEGHSAESLLCKQMKQVIKKYIILHIYCHLCFITAPSASPQNLTGSSLNSRTISLSWSPPPTLETNGVVREYRVNVTEVESGTVFTLTSTTTSITLQSLHPYYNYRCVVSTYTVGIGPYTAVFNIRTPEDCKLHIYIKHGHCMSNLSPIVPSGYPQSLSVMPTTSRSALLQWEPPNEADRNGIVTEYIINVSAVETGEDFQLISTNTSLTVTHLRPYTTYQCIIAASTSVGIGPFSTVVTVITPEDGKRSYQNSRSAHVIFSHSSNQCTTSSKWVCNQLQQCLSHMGSSTPAGETWHHQGIPDKPH